MALINLQIGTNRHNDINGTDWIDLIFGLAGDDKIKAFGGNDWVFAGSGQDTVSGGAGDDWLFGGAGRDTLSGEEGNDYLNGGSGDDALDGGLGDDELWGGSGNDLLIGGKGNDSVYGGRGNDIMTWVNGDGSDIMSGGSGYDTVAVEGSLTAGDNFVLGKTSNHRALFERTGLDNQPIGRFTLTVDTSEVFDVVGGGGDDTLLVNDLSGTGVELIKFDGGDGVDQLDASNSSVRVIARGGTGNDTLIGSRFDDQLTGGDGVDRLTGGAGRDRFVYNGNPFANGTPNVAANGIPVLNQPDVITDFTIREDQFALDRQDLGIGNIQFVEATATHLSDGNVFNLLGGFANAAAAAKAIADNDAVTAKEGVFIYFNTNLGFSRLVYSSNLAEGGAISVLANLTNQTVLADQVNFSRNDFVLI